MRHKLRLITLTAALSLLLTGCFSWSAEDSYKLPQASADYESLTRAVSQTKRELATEYSTTVEDVPPSAGDNTSTVQLLDMDGDGEQETAVSFLRVVGADMPVRICFYTLGRDASYAAGPVIKGEGDGVYAVHYADVDGRRDSWDRTCKEVVVSWQLGSEAYYLGVYALDGGEVQELAATAYDSYRLADLDRDGLMELAVGRVDDELKQGEVVLWDWAADGQRREQRTALSAGLTAIRQMKANYLTDMVPALYVSGDLADGQRVTDVVAMKNGMLTDLSLDPDTGVSVETADPYREVAASDVNSDTILELARPRQLTSYGTGSGAWLNDWVQYDENGRARPVCTTYHNVADGWYLVIPQNWQSRLIITRNDSVSGQRAVNFSLWQGEDREPLPFLSIYKLTGASRSLRAASGSRFILAEDSSTIYAATFYSTWDCGLDQSGLLENFRLIVSSWSSD